MLDIPTLSTLFKSIGDPLRLRLLHLLCVEELGVGELVRILELPQSTVSRHLKVLREQGLIADRPEGPATYYRAQLEADLGDGETVLRDLLVALMKESELPPADREGLDRVLALRESDCEGFFDRIGLRWDALREECFGSTFHLEALLHLLPAELTVADLGTGTGYLLPALGRHYRRVIGVDASPPMLELAGRRVAEAGLTNVELRPGEIEHLPLTDAEADLAIALLILHHVGDVAGTLGEIARVLRPGGQLLLVEIHPHENETFRVQMADRRAGVDMGELKGLLGTTGFRDLQSWELPNRERPEHVLAPLPRLYCVAGKKGGYAEDRREDAEDRRGETKHNHG